MRQSKMNSASAKKSGKKQNKEIGFQSYYFEKQSYPKVVESPPLSEQSEEIQIYGGPFGKRTPAKSQDENMSLRLQEFLKKPLILSEEKQLEINQESRQGKINEKSVRKQKINQLGINEKEGVDLNSLYGDFKIIKCFKSLGNKEVMFEIKLKKTGQKVEVPSQVLQTINPYPIIQYYEKKIAFQ